MGRKTAAEKAEERRVAEAIHGLRFPFVECRTIGHSWQILYIGPAARADEELATRARHHPWRPDGARVLGCSRCGTERIDLCLIGYGRASYTYTPVSRYYRYPDNYQVEGGIGRGRGHLHEELFRRIGDEQ